MLFKGLGFQLPMLTLLTLPWRLAPLGLPPNAPLDTLFNTLADKTPPFTQIEDDGHEIIKQQNLPTTIPIPISPPSYNV